MTVGKFAQIIKENNIPEDAVMLSDSGWECSSTDMDGVYYNKETNEIMFTQEGDEYDHDYYNVSPWQLLHSKEKAEFHCGVEESGFHAYNCNYCPNKCEEYYQWDKEFKSMIRKENKNAT